MILRLQMTGRCKELVLIPCPRDARRTETLTSVVVSGRHKWAACWNSCHSSVVGRCALLMETWSEGGNSVSKGQNWAKLLTKAMDTQLFLFILFSIHTVMVHGHKLTIGLISNDYVEKSLSDDVSLQVAKQLLLLNCIYIKTKACQLNILGALHCLTNKRPNLRRMTVSNSQLQWLAC